MTDLKKFSRPLDEPNLHNQLNRLISNLETEFANRDTAIAASNTQITTLQKQIADAHAAIANLKTQLSE